MKKTPPPPVPTIKAPKPGSPMDWLKQIWGDFTKQHGDLAAAAVAVFGLLSLVPIMLLAVSVFTLYEAHKSGLHGVSPSDAAWNHLRPQLEQFVGGSTSKAVAGEKEENLLLSTVQGMLHKSSSAGIIGLVGLVWSGSRIFNIITETFDEAWLITQGRNFIKQNLVSLAMLLGMGTIFIASLGAAAAAKYFQHLFEGMLPESVAGMLGPAVSIALNILTSIALFVVMYKWAPNRKVDWKPALFGGVIGGTLWAIFQQLFRFYVSHYSSYNKAYGTMAGIVILILWAYYSAYILILGCVASAVYSERVCGERGPDDSTDGSGKNRRQKAQELSEQSKGGKAATGMKK
ncbi:MAG: YihY/virulence factor BrkB family protein [Armatimonadota bacterium]|nr:YihY/virulence factor BrkB family protein [Armatimonadota bacterium]